MPKVIALHYSDGHFFGVTFKPEARDGKFVGVAEVTGKKLEPFLERPESFEVEGKGRKADAAG